MPPETLKEIAAGDFHDDTIQMPPDNGMQSLVRVYLRRILNSVHNGGRLE